MNYLEKQTNKQTSLLLMCPTKMSRALSHCVQPIYIWTLIAEVKDWSKLIGEKVRQTERQKGRRRVREKSIETDRFPR